MHTTLQARPGLSLAALALIALLVIGCRATPAQTPGAPAVNAAGYYDLTVDGLAQMLAEGDAFTLVNVHVPYGGEIAGTDVHIAYNEIANHLDRLPAKDSPIVLYCRSGAMSVEAAKTLVEHRYTAVWELNGGMVAWSAGGHELVNK